MKRVISSIGGHNIETVFMQVYEIIGQLLEQRDYPGERRGGYLTIAKRDTGIMLLHARIGDVPVDKEECYSTLSREKANRLWQHQTFDGHLSSRQSRDLSADRFGGAIVANNLIVSFSGLIEEADEALVAELACRLGWLKQEEALDICQLCGSNLLFLHLRGILR